MSVQLEATRVAQLCCLDGERTAYQAYVGAQHQKPWGFMPEPMCCVILVPHPLWASIFPPVWLVAVPKSI